MRGYKNKIVERKFKFSFFDLESPKNSEVVKFHLSLLMGQAYSINGFNLSGLISVTETNFQGLGFSGCGNIIKNNFLGGVYISSAFNYVKNSSRGVQLSGFLNYAKDTSGIQAGVLNIAPDMKGLQLGTLNISQKLEGLQAGVLNISKKSKGMQFGILNIAKESEYYPFGLLNIVGGSKFSLTSWIDECGFVNFGVRQGKRNGYNVYFMGKNHNRYSFGLGYGFNIMPQNNIFPTIEISARNIFKGDKIFSSKKAVGQASLKAMLNIRMFKKGLIFLGASYNYARTSSEKGDYNDLRDLKPVFKSLVFNPDSKNDRHWIGLFIGVSYSLSN